MDQDSFRQLLSASDRQKTAAKTKLPHKQISASEPAFKPRKVKKSSATYRDRAAERREGGEHEYSKVEAVLEEFNIVTAGKDKETIETQRQYLGGDSDHTVLVKGLDFALLEQKKVQEGPLIDDDELLEDTFQSVKPRKHTRQELIEELKASREQKEVSGSAESKDKPINSKFKPIGEEKPEKKRKGRPEGERKKKKRRIEAAASDSLMPSTSTASHPLPAPPQPSEPDPPEDFDIFADVSEYKGLNSDDEDEDVPSIHVAPDITPGKWFVKDESPPRHTPHIPLELPLPHEEDDNSTEIRLTPLTSSVLPSIKDLLALDEAAEKADKKKQRKEKHKQKGGGGGNEDKPKMSAENRAERDYQRLKSYTDKKSKS